MAMSTRHQRATHVVHAANQPASGGMAHAHSNLAVANHGTEWLDLREMTRKLWRGRRMIAVLTVLGTVVGAAAVSQLEEAYTATNTIMLETREREVFDAKAVLQNLTVSDAIVESEVEVLQSRELIKRVALELGAYEDEELTKGFYETEPEGWLAEVKELVKTQISSLMADDSIDDLAALAASADDEASELQKTVIDAMYDRLSVEGGGEVPVIRVSYTSEDPRKAAAHANAFAQTYISTQVEVKSDATRQASGWLKDRIALLQREVEEKERQVEDLRSEVGILDGTLNDVSVASQQAAELSSQHIAAMLERQRAEAALEQNVETELLASPVLQGLRLKEEEVSREIAEKSTEFGPNHPTIQNLRESLAGTKAGIEVERQNVIAKLRSEVQSARQREAELSRSFDELSSSLKDVGGKQVEIRALERDVEARRALLENFLAREQETSQQEDIQQPDAWIISHAEVPNSPSFPNTKLFLLLSFCGSAFVGVSISYLLQSLDKTIHTADQLKEELGIQHVQIVPKLADRRAGLDPVSFILNKPNSAFAESLRNIQAAASKAETPPRVLLFLSSVPSEGKTSLTLSFGRFLALNGYSVVVVDCDLRKPRVHDVFGGERAPGLVDVLDSDVPLDEVIRADRDTELDYIPAGRPTARSTSLLAKEKMQNTIEDLKQSYDIVLIDSAPILAIADTQYLVPFADRVQFVVRWRSTHQKAVVQAFGLLMEAGSWEVPVGVLLNQVDERTYLEFDDYDYFEAGKGYYVD